MAQKKHSSLESHAEKIASQVSAILASTGLSIESQAPIEAGASNSTPQVPPESIVSVLGSQEFRQALKFALIDASVSTSRKPAQWVGLPENGLLRLPQIIGEPNADPPIPAMVPVCRATWWAGIKNGKYPKGIKLSPRVTVWRTADILALIANPDRGAKA
jgi:prophage regulatory protein